MFSQCIRSSHQIVDVGREVGVGEIAFAIAEPCEIESENGDAAFCQFARDSRGGVHIFRTAKTVRENRILIGRRRWQFQASGKRFVA